MQPPPPPSPPTLHLSLCFLTHICWCFILLLWQQSQWSRSSRICRQRHWAAQPRCHVTRTAVPNHRSHGSRRTESFLCTLYYTLLLNDSNKLISETLHPSVIRTRLSAVLKKKSSRIKSMRSQFVPIEKRFVGTVHIAMVLSVAFLFDTVCFCHICSFFCVGHFIWNDCSVLA